MWLGMADQRPKAGDNLQAAKSVHPRPTEALAPGPLNSKELQAATGEVMPTPAVEKVRRVSDHLTAEKAEAKEAVPEPPTPKTHGREQEQPKPKQPAVETGPGSARTQTTTPAKKGPEPDPAEPREPAHPPAPTPAGPARVKSPTPTPADSVLEKRLLAGENELLARLSEVPEVRLFKDEEVQEFRKQADAAQRSLRGVLVAKLHQDMIGAGKKEGLPFVSISKAQLSPAAAVIMDKLSTELRDMGFVSGFPSSGSSRPSVENKPLEKLGVFQQWCDQSHIVKFSGALPTMLQMLQVEDTPLRLLLVRELAKVKNRDTTKGLASRALFDLAPQVREEAIKALEKRHPSHYTPALVKGLRYPWPPVADHAAQALRKLRPEAAIPDLVDMLDLPDPCAPVTRLGKPVVRELVRLDHMRNCLVCHPPLLKDNLKSLEGLPNGSVPVPGVPAPSGYDKARGTLFARADVTFLRQDFSVPLGNQRFDFVTRTRPANPGELQNITTKQSSYPQREAVLYALRGITGKDMGDSTYKWRQLLDGITDKDPALEKAPVLDTAGAGTAIKDRKSFLDQFIVPKKPAADSRPRR
jgi:hypothetical protein